MTTSSSAGIRPTAHAAASNAAKRELRIVPAGEPGDQHCQVDLPSIAIDIIGDWFQGILG